MDRIYFSILIIVKNCHCFLRPFLSMSIHLLSVLSNSWHLRVWSPFTKLSHTAEHFWTVFPTTTLHVTHTELRQKCTLGDKNVNNGEYRIFLWRQGGQCSAQRITETTAHQYKCYVINYVFRSNTIVSTFSRVIVVHNSPHHPFSF